MTEGNGGLDPQAAAVQAGLAMHLKVKGELEDARKEIARLQMEVSNAAIKVDSLQRWIDTLEERMTEAVQVRDEAVAERALLAGLFCVIDASMREFKINIKEGTHGKETAQENQGSHQGAKETGTRHRSKVDGPFGRD